MNILLLQLLFFSSFSPLVLLWFYRVYKVHSNPSTAHCTKETRQHNSNNINTPNTTITTTSHTHKHPADISGTDFRVPRSVRAPLSFVRSFKHPAAASQGAHARLRAAPTAARRRMSAAHRRQLSALYDEILLSVRGLVRVPPPCAAILYVPSLSGVQLTILVRTRPSHSNRMRSAQTESRRASALRW